MSVESRNEFKIALKKLLGVERYCDLLDDQDDFARFDEHSIPTIISDKLSVAELEIYKKYLRIRNDHIGDIDIDINLLTLLVDIDEYAKDEWNAWLIGTKPPKICGFMQDLDYHITSLKIKLKMV